MASVGRLGAATAIVDTAASGFATASVSPPRMGTVLTCIGWPRDEATGPVTSLLELAQAMSGDYAFRVVARERKARLFNKSTGSERWEKHRSIERYWSSMTWLGPRHFADLLRSPPHDILMLNGFFDPEFTMPALLLRRLGRVPRRPTVLSTRGELALGALSLKSTRKRAYLSLARRLGLLSDVWLHATGPREAADIAKVFPWSRGVLVAPNVRLLPALPSRQAANEETPGVTRLAFLGRIARVKNLDYALKVLGEVRARVNLDIYGPVGEPDHWRECQGMIAAMPPNITVAYKGEIPNSDVIETLAGNDLLFLPTRGENFGHAILEALAGGVPVLISDQTPWQNLESHAAGWSLSLAEPSAFGKVIERIAAMEPDERARLRRGARALAEARIAADDAVARNREMLATLLRDGRQP